MRPNLVWKIKVRNIYPDDYEIKDGKLRFTVKPPMIIVPRWVCDRKGCDKGVFDCDSCKEESKIHADGNKASILFVIFVPSVIADKMELYVNQDGDVNLDTPLTNTETERDVSYIIRKYYRKIGFEGEPYRLRDYADRMLLSRLEMVYSNKNLKEFLMGHTVNDISFTYDIKGLSKETREKWRSQYVGAVEGWVNENIFSIASAKDMEIAKNVMLFAKAQGVSDEHLTAIMSIFEKGKMTLDDLRNRILAVTEKAQEEKWRGQFNRWLSEELPKMLEAKKGEG